MRHLLTIAASLIVIAFLVACVSKATPTALPAATPTQVTALPPTLSGPLDSYLNAYRAVTKPAALLDLVAPESPLHAAVRAWAERMGEMAMTIPTVAVRHVDLQDDEAILYTLERYCSAETQCPVFRLEHHLRYDGEQWWLQGLHLVSLLPGEEDAWAQKDIGPLRVTYRLDSPWAAEALERLLMDVQTVEERVGPLTGVELLLLPDEEAWRAHFETPLPGELCDATGACGFGDWPLTVVTFMFEPAEFVILPRQLTHMALAGRLCPVSATALAGRCWFSLGTAQVGQWQSLLDCPYIPRWFRTGLALNVAGQWDREVVAAEMLWAQTFEVTFAEVEDHFRKGPGLASMTSSSIVAFLLERKGQAGVDELLNRLEEGQPFEKALLAVYEVDSVEQLEEQWRAWAR